MVDISHHCDERGCMAGAVTLIFGEAFRAVRWVCGMHCSVCIAPMFPFSKSSYQTS